ncbi:MAG: HmuY family protein, partial [Daejeonella sp.]
TYSMYYTSNGATVIPYGFSDLVFTNYLGGAQIAEVLINDALTYDNFSESNIAQVTFSTERAAIGSKWRATSGPNGALPGVKTDRFYVIKDAAGNIYKLKFTSFILQDGGERGKPTLTYALVKKGS